jgi:hypothetical protein
MKCTSCGLNLDMRKKSQYVFASYQIQSKGILNNLFKKDHWIFCSMPCKRKADSDWISGDFEKKHGNKKINFKP